MVLSVTFFDCGTVRAYKGLSVVERAFRSLETVDLKVRPIDHYAGARVRAHVFLCMLAYYVEWHMRQRLKPLLFDDEEPQAAEAARPSVVAPAEVSPSAQDKARRKRTASGEPVHSFRTLLDDLATVASNRVVAPLADTRPFDLITRPTALLRWQWRRPQSTSWRIDETYVKVRGKWAYLYRALRTSSRSNPDGIVSSP